MGKNIRGRIFAAVVAAAAVMNAAVTEVFAETAAAVSAEAVSPGGEAVSGIPSSLISAEEASGSGQASEEQAGGMPRNNVIMAGSSGAGGIQTEGEKNPSSQTALLGGASLTMFHSQTNSQILSCLIQTNNGELIVVDGGFGSDADYLTSQIQARGGRVSAWLVTHPHADHVGALYQILQNEDVRYASGQPAGIMIDQIYYSFADLNWYFENDPRESTMEEAIIGSFSGRVSLLHPVTRGEIIQVDTAQIQVMNNRYEMASDKGNNSCIVYKVTVNGVSILFLGDMGREGGSALLAEAGADALKSDIVQMAHHGQNGVSEEFYQAVRPSVCLWPTPDWLWGSMESKYTIQVTKQWMKNLGVEKHYCTKDGDQVIY